MIKRNSIINVINKKILLSILFSVIFFSIVSFSITYSIEKKDLEKKSAILADKLTGLLKAPLWNFDSDLTKELVNVFINNTNVCVIKVYDSNGKLIYSAKDHKFNDKDKDKHLILKRKIKYKNYDLGTLEVYFTEQYIFNKVKTFLFINFIQVTFIAIVLTFFSKNIIKSHILEPLRVLTDTINSISIGNFKEIIDEDFKYEFASIKEVFNKMTENLNRYNREIQNANFKLMSLLDTIPDAVILHDKNGKILETNKTTEIFYGYTSLELYNKSIEELSSKGYTQDLANEKIKDALKKGYNEFEWKVRHKNGSEFPAIVRLKKLVLDNEDYILSVVTDISKQKKNEEKILEEKEKLNIILRSIGDGIIVTDNSGLILISNTSAQKITGYVEKEIYACNISSVLQILEPKNKERIYGFVEDVILNGKVKEFEQGTILITKNGEEKLIQGICSPIIDSFNDIIGVVIVFRDVTEKEKIEQELIKNQKLESVGLLAAGIAHDFNNLLAAISSYMSMLKINNEDKDCEKYIYDIESILERAKALTNQLLTFSKGGAPVKEFLHVCYVVKDTAKFVLRGSGVKLKIQRDDDLWVTEIDENQMSQAIHNIVLNAKQAMNNKGILDISINNMEVDDNNEYLIPKGKYVKISVKDTGEGIEPEALNNIFDPFFTTKENGNGLGLAMTHSIVKKHNGYINVHSVKGKGTTFEILLPAVDKQIESKLCENKTIYIKNNARILLLDDEKIIRESANELLSFLGYDVVCVSDGKEVLDEYEKALKKHNKYDVVILDLTIPGGMGGKETLDELIKIDKKVVAIVSSGYSDDEIMAEYEKYGFKGVIAKPYNLEKISSVINQVLDD